MCVTNNPFILELVNILTCTCEYFLYPIMSPVGLVFDQIEIHVQEAEMFSSSL